MRVSKNTFYIAISVIHNCFFPSTSILLSVMFSLLLSFRLSINSSASSLFAICLSSFLSSFLSVYLSFFCLAVCLFFYLSIVLSLFECSLFPRLMTIHNFSLIFNNFKIYYTLHLYLNFSLPFRLNICILHLLFFSYCVFSFVSSPQIAEAAVGS